MPDIWLPDIITHIVHYLDDNEVTCTLRLVDKSLARLFAHRVRVRLSQPVPYHAFHSYWASPNAMRCLSFYNRLKLLALTAGSGCLSNLEVAAQHAGCDLGVRRSYFNTSEEVLILDPLAAAASAGHIHICEWLLQHGFLLDDENHVNAAAMAGSQEACAWLLDHGCPCSMYQVLAAFRGGHPELMEWLLARCPPEARSRVIWQALLSVAAEHYNLATLQQVYSKWVQGQPNENQQLYRIASTAACSPTPDWLAKFAWLEQKGIIREPWGWVDFGAAVSCPDAVERLQWVKARGYRVATRETVLAAIRVGNMAALQYIMSQSTQDVLERRGAGLGRVIRSAKCVAVRYRVTVLI